MYLDLDSGGKHTAPKRLETLLASVSPLVPARKRQSPSTHTQDAQGCRRCAIAVQFVGRFRALGVCTGWMMSASSIGAGRAAATPAIWRARRSPRARRLLPHARRGAGGGAGPLALGPGDASPAGDRPGCPRGGWGVHRADGWEAPGRSVAAQGGCRRLSRRRDRRDVQRPEVGVGRVGAGGPVAARADRGSARPGGRALGGYLRERVPVVRRRYGGQVIEEPAKDVIATAYRHTTARGVSGC